MAVKRCCVIGYGHWGPNVVRNIKCSSDLKLLYLVEPNLTRQEAYIKTYGRDVLFLLDIRDLEDDIDIAFVCSSTESHHRIVEFLLNIGVDVYCEKPFGLDSVNSKRLFEFAKEKNLLVWINFPYLFHPAILKIDNLLSEQRENFGVIESIRSERSNFFGRMMSVDVVRDLMIHDFAILRFLFGSLNFIKFHFDDLSPLYEEKNQVVFYGRHELGIGVSFLASHKSPIKQRRLQINTENGGLSFDESLIPSQLQVLRIKSSIDVHPDSKAMWSNSQADIYSPQLDFVEPLQQSIISFVNSLEERDREQEFSMFHRRLMDVYTETSLFVGDLFNGKELK